MLETLEINIMMSVTIETRRINIKRHKDYEKEYTVHKNSSN